MRLTQPEVFTSLVLINLLIYHVHLFLTASTAYSFVTDFSLLQQHMVFLQIYYCLHTVHSFLWTATAPVEEFLKTLPPPLRKTLLDESAYIRRKIQF